MRKKLAVMVSGGRTSGFMAALIKAHSAFKDYDPLFFYCNTGKELEPTLEFLKQCDEHFSLNLIWLEAVVNPDMGIGTTHKVIDFASAKRKGEPFAEVIAKYGLPSVSFSHCTRELKVRPVQSYMRSIGILQYTKAIGIRDDEPHRLTADPDTIYPLAKIVPVNKGTVRLFWDNQPFDLQITEEQGNCDFCFKKSLRKKLTIAKNNPETLKWWSEQEEAFSDGRVSMFNHREQLTINQIMELSKRPFNKFKEGDLQPSLLAIMDQELACICKST